MSEGMTEKERNEARIAILDFCTGGGKRMAQILKMPTLQNLIRKYDKNHVKSVVYQLEGAAALYGAGVRGGRVYATTQIGATLVSEYRKL